MTNNKKIFLLQTIQLIISIIIFASISFTVEQIEEFTLPKPYNYIQLGLAFLLIILYILEFVFKPAKKRIIYFALSLFVILITAKSINTLNESIWALSLVYALIMILVVLRSNVNNENVNGLPKDTKKTLSVGMFSLKQQRINFTYVYISFLLIIGLGIFLVLSDNTKLFYLPLIASIILFIGLIFITAYTSPFAAALRLINNKCNYNEMMELINEIKDNNLHSDSLIMIKIIEANYTSTVDLEQANLIWDEIKDTKPLNKQYLLNYLFVEISLAISNRDFLLANELINNLKIKYVKNAKVLKGLEQFVNCINALQTNEEIKDIELNLPLTTKLLFNNITNAHYLMNYYYKLKIKEEEQTKLANYIITNAPELKLLVLDANKVLNGGQHEYQI